MIETESTGLLTLYSDVRAAAVHWLWYPFIASGKITLLQGDPGDGKSTMMMRLIAELSTGGVTPDGCPWNSSSLAGVIANERHCGDVLARKTFTPNFLTHKSKKNRNDRTQYRQRDHHEAIVSREVFHAANRLRASRSYGRKSHPLPVLSVVADGILKGYVPFDKDWMGFSVDEYQKASESVMKDAPKETV